MEREITVTALRVGCTEDMRTLTLITEDEVLTTSHRCLFEYLNTLLPENATQEGIEASR